MLRCRCPPGLALEQAAAVPEAFATAYDNLLVRGRLQAGETALIHGGDSGVGTAAVQLARRHGATVLVTARTAERVHACRAIGADGGFPYPDADIAGEVSARTGGRGADVILDVVGGAYLEANVRSLAVEGRLVVIGLQGGATGPLDLARMLRCRLSVAGSTLRARTEHERQPLLAGLLTDVWPGFADGSLRPVVDRVMPLEAVADAHRLLEASDHVGKIVLRVD